MAYFELAKNPDGKTKPIDLPAYPFDFHSHFNGILPVSIGKKQKTKLEKNDGIPVTIPEGTELTLLGLLKLANKDNTNLKDKDPNILLFQHALELMKKNPFGNVDSFKGESCHTYQRGECAAESLFIACCLIERLGSDRKYIHILDPQFYESISLVVDKIDTASADGKKILNIITYFNKKICSANKYTPFDDAYWARSCVADEYNDFFNVMTLCYLYAEHILYAQIACSGKEKTIKKLNTLLEKFNSNSTQNDPKPQYKLLAQSAAIYDKDVQGEQFKKDISDIMRLLNNAEYNNLIGIDLLGSETNLGLYDEFFTAIKDFVPKKKTTLHIHCGEGSGVTVSNRSLFGYYCNRRFNGKPASDIPADAFEEFSRKLATFAGDCYDNTVEMKSARERERKLSNQEIKDYSEVSGLFDELYFRNTLIVDGVALKRFDITSAVSRDRVRYIAKTNLTAFCNALGKENGKKIYELKGTADPIKDKLIYQIRIGHAYYDRNYLGSRFPDLYYDTNLGSNFITGASGQFDSAQFYRLNKGLRHLNGYMDTNVIDRMRSQIFYMEESDLALDQISFARSIAIKVIGGDIDVGKAALAALGNDENGDASAQKKAIQELLRINNDPDSTYTDKLVSYIKKIADLYHLGIQNWGNIKSSSTKKELVLNASVSIVSAALSWRSYILGADGQGVEHSDVQAELARMTMLMTYGLDFGFETVSEDLIKANYTLIREISKAYWIETTDLKIDDPQWNAIKNDYQTITRFEGFKSPDSVVHVNTQPKQP